MSMECRWEDNDKRINGYLVMHRSRCHLAPHNFYVGQPGIESGPVRQDCDRWQPKYSAETLPHATKSKLTRTGPWWNPGFRGERPATSRRLAALATARSSDLQKYESRPTFLTNTSRYPKQNCLVWSFPDFTPLILLTTALPVRRWVRSIGGTTWQGKPEVAQSEKKLGNDNLSTKNPIWNGMGSNLGPRDDRPADNRLSHGTRTEACTWSHLFKLGSHRTENPLCLRYRHQNVSAIIGTNFCLFAVSYAKHYHNIGRKQTTS